LDSVVAGSFADTYQNNMDTVKKAVASANEAVASAAQSAKETLSGVQHQVGVPPLGSNCYYA
jgi:hypothetical protein